MLEFAARKDATCIDSAFTVQNTSEINKKNAHKVGVKLHLLIDKNNN